MDEIWHYIAEDNVAAAHKVVAEIETALGEALRFPQIGHLRPDLTSRPLHFLPVYDYLVSYVFDEERLVAVAILHGRRNPKTLAALLRGRQQ